MNSKDTSTDVQQSKRSFSKLKLPHNRVREESTGIESLANSPVSDLTLNLEVLSTGSKQQNIARRKLSLIVADQLISSPLSSLSQTPSLTPNSSCSSSAIHGSCTSNGCFSSSCIGDASSCINNCSSCIDNTGCCIGDTSRPDLKTSPDSVGTCSSAFTSCTGSSSSSCSSFAYEISLSCSNEVGNRSSCSAEKQVSLDEGCYVDTGCTSSPEVQDSPFLQSNNAALTHDSKPICLRRLQSFPPPFCGFEPTPPLGPPCSRTEVKSGVRVLSRMCRSDSSTLNDISSPLYVPGVAAISESAAGCERKLVAYEGTENVYKQCEDLVLKVPARARPVASTALLVDITNQERSGFRRSFSWNNSAQKKDVKSDNSGKFQTLRKQTSDLSSHNLTSQNQKCDLSLQKELSLSHKSDNQNDNQQDEIYLKPSEGQSVVEQKLDSPYLSTGTIMDICEPQTSCPKSLGALFFSPVYEQTETDLNTSTEQNNSADCSVTDDSPTSKIEFADSNGGLFRTPSAPNFIRFTVSNRRFGMGAQTLEDSEMRHRRRFKRSESQREDRCTPQQIKRRRGSINAEGETTGERNDVAMGSSERRKIMRCHSEAELSIKKALSWGDAQDLIGDFSRPYCLPLVRGKHQDLKAISCDTLVDIMNNEYSETIEKYVIIDSRYPYEYHGGHIKGAKNLYLKDDILKQFFEIDKYKSSEVTQSSSSSSRRTVFIFHCEFSSQRGPELSRFLRNRDRDLHRDSYPHLFYPELYLLDGGYKAFYESHPQYCSPEGYLPMLHENHLDDLKHFRAKTNSWVNDKCKGGVRNSVWNK